MSQINTNYKSCSVKVSNIILLMIVFYSQLTNLQRINALILKCPLHQMHLQKIVGFRPPIEFMTDKNVIFQTLSDPISSRNNHTALLNQVKSESAYKSQSPANTTDYKESEQLNAEIFLDTISSICWRLCYENVNCIAYVHLLNGNKCYGYTYFERSDENLMRVDGDNLPLIADSEAIFYEKSCLKVPEHCKERLWILTKIPGNSLVFQGKKTLPTLVTRRQCAESCLFENEFQCLSASFAPSYRNNRNRSPIVTSEAKEHQVSLGRCILSDRDKLIQPDAFRAAPYEDEYIENQCHTRKAENNQCSYELYANSTFIYADTKIMGLSQKDCQTFCSRETKFYCQGVSFHYDDNINISECLLHSEDIISLGPRSLKFRENSVYMRRVQCLNVQVTCTRNEMMIKYMPKDWFRGKLYVSQHSKDCMIDGHGTQSTVLRLSIGNESKENRCGIIRAYEVTKGFQRIFISTLVVIQNNPNVQTQGDRLIKVGCVISNATTSTTTNTYKVLPITHQSSAGNAVIMDDNEKAPNAIALESSLDFSKSFLLNEGTLQYNNINNYQPMPQITLQVLDSGRKHLTDNVQIGQSLELQIAAEYTQQQLRELASGKEMPPVPDFRATSLVAKTENGENYVLLIDERGCPTDPAVFASLQRIHLPNKSLLRTKFRAFKFAGTQMVKFEVKIHFCKGKCPEDNCLTGHRINEWDSSHSYQNSRKKRQLLNPTNEVQSVKIQNPVYISTVADVWDDINLNESNNENSTLPTVNGDNVIPLNFNLHVRGPNHTTTNSFIYSERGVLLIAGIDDYSHLDNICLNQSLLVAILIFWLIVQVALMFSCCYVIQKYKRSSLMDEEKRKIYENLEYLESRRVHWADQGGYSV